MPGLGTTGEDPADGVCPMRIPIVAVATFSLLAALLWLALLDRGSPDRPASVPHTEGNKLLSRLPVAFEPNVGQFRESTRYMARLRTMTVLLEEDGWLLRMERPSESTKAAPGTSHSEAVRMKFVWRGPRVPPNCPPSGLSSSNALHVVFQP
jgi:hypothetical protein